MPVNYEGDDSAWPTTIPVIADGEGLAERNLAPGLRKNADRSAYNRRVLPTLHRYVTDSGSPFYAYLNSGNVESTIAAGGKVDVADCAIGDVLLCTASFLLLRTGTETDEFDIWIDALDTVDATPGTQTHIDGAHYDAADGVDAEQLGIVFPVTLHGSWTVAAAGTTRICIALSSTETSGGDDTEIRPGIAITVVRFPVL
jgi:hypothetical protein